MTFTELDRRVSELVELSKRNPGRDPDSSFGLKKSHLHRDVLRAIADGQITDPYEAAHRVMALEAL